MLVVAGTAGGVGCSTVAAWLAVYGARRGPTLLVDLRGDLAALLGVAEPVVGLDAWMSTISPPPDALCRLEVEVADGLHLLVPGASRPVGEQRPIGEQRPVGLELLAAVLMADDRLVVVDAGPLNDAPRPVLVGADRLLAVAKLCHLGLTSARRFVTVGERMVDGAVVVSEPGRLLGPDDVSEALAAPVQALLRWDPAVAAAIDSGGFAARPPRRLRDLGRLLP